MAAQAPTAACPSPLFLLFVAAGAAALSEQARRCGNRDRNSGAADHPPRARSSASGCAADRIYTADLAGIDTLPRGAKLAVAQPEGLFHVTPIPEVHLATLAIARARRLRADPLRDPRSAARDAEAGLCSTLPAAAQPTVLWAGTRLPAVPPSGCSACPARRFRFRGVSPTSGPIHVPENSCLTPFFVQPTLQIFSVVHEARCISPAGKPDHGASPCQGRRPSIAI